MSVREKFHLALYGGLFGMYLIIFVGCAVLYKIESAFIILLLYFALLCCCIEQIKCPHCKTKLILYYRPTSKYYKGFHFLLPKKCFCCGKKN